MKDIVLGLYAAILPIVLGYVVKLLKDNKKERNANSRGTMLLLRVQPIEYHDKYVKLGSIPSYAYSNFVDMYKAYRALGGNGLILKMKREVDRIHLGRAAR